MKRPKQRPQAMKKHARRLNHADWAKRLMEGRWAVIVAVLFICSLLLPMVPTDTLLPIEKISIAGRFRHLDGDVMKRAMEPYLGKGFFAVDINHIQDRLGEHPWIRSVSVKRQWPNGLLVRVEERQAVARWDQQQLLSSKGVVFQAVGSEFDYLPEVNGYAAQSLELLKRFQRLHETFAAQGIRLSAMKEDSKGALSLRLDEGLKVNIGSDKGDEKISQLLAVYANWIKPRVGDIEIIDFRYSNGFAIAWKKEAIEKGDAMTSKGKDHV